MAESNGECAMADEKAFDVTRTLLLTGLEELENDDGTCDEKNELLKEAVQNMMAELYSLPIDTVEKVVKATNDDGIPAAMVLFKSRLNKNRVYTQREKLPKTVKATLTIVHKIVKKEESTEKKDESTTLSTAVEEQPGNDFVVKDEIGEEELDEKEILGDEEMEKKEEPETEEMSQSIIQADKHDADDDHDMADEAEDKHEPDDMDEQEHMEDEENTGSDQKIKESDEPKHSTDKPKDVDWNGCPEFQWKRVSSPEDRAKIILDNVSVTDLQNPWLYQTVLRARSVTFNFLSNIYKGNFEHNVLRKGRLILGFGSDGQAMAQATNSLVYLRTPQHRRIKIYLPQSPGAMKQSKQLEQKMGRVLELRLSSRQLLVRSVSDNCDGELIKLRFGVAPDEITKTEFREDGLGRRCAVVTFATPELATLTHMKHDELKVGSNNHWARVWYMRDILPKPLMLKPEVKLNLDRVKFDSQDSDVSPKKAVQETKSESNAEKLQEDTLSSEDGGAKGSPAAAKVVKSVEKEKESAKRSYPERRSSDSRSADRKRQRSRSPVPFSKRPAIQSDRGRGRGRGSPRGGFRDVNGPPRGRGHRPFRGSARGGRYFDRGMNRGRGDFNRGRSGGRGEGRTNPWSPMEGAIGGASLDSMQTMIAEQQRQLEMQQQLLKQQEALDKMQMEISRRKSAPTSNYSTGYDNRSNTGGFSGSAMGSSGGYLPMTSTAMGSSASSSFSSGTPYGRGHYNGPSGQTGNRGYSPPLYQSPTRGSGNYRN